MAAPIASQVLGEVLPYLELKKDNESPEDTVTSTTVPEIRNKTIKEAKTILKKAGLNLEINSSEEIDENTVIVEQTPKPGINVNSGIKVYIDI